MKIIRGMFYYGEENAVGFCAALLEHLGVRHVWLSFITGGWPGTNQPDTYVTADIWCGLDGRVMSIEDSAASPFMADEVFKCHPVTREQVLAVKGGKEWFIDTYLLLFETDEVIRGYLNGCS